MTADEETPLVRNGTTPRSAFYSGDKEASVRSHEARKGNVVRSEEEHSAAGDRLKAITFGGLDGILTSFAIVAGAAGGKLGWQVVVVLGISNVLADAWSMGVGEYLSSRAEREWMAQERQREAWELENHAEGEVQEMIEIYMEKGVSREDAEAVLGTLSKYKDFFVDHMMAMELGMIVEEESDFGAITNGFIMFLSFAFFGACPILVYAVVPLAVGNDALSSESLFAVACVVTACALFALGALKAKFSTSKWYAAGAETLLLGGACAALAYLVGRAVAPLTAD